MFKAYVVDGPLAPNHVYRLCFEGKVAHVAYNAFNPVVYTLGTAFFHRLFYKEREEVEGLHPCLGMKRQLHGLATTATSEVGYDGILIQKSHHT